MRRSGLIALLMVAAVLAGLAASVYVVARSPGTTQLVELSFSFGVATFTLVGAVIVWRQSTNRIGVWLRPAVGVKR